MSRYIDADALCEEFTRFVRKANTHDFAPTPNWNDAISIFHSMPIEDVAPVVHGKWTTKFVDFPNICCVCNKQAREKTEYCPHCGAKMEVSDEV